MADSSNDPSLWSFIGPAAQIGAGLYASLNGSGQVVGGYNNAYGTAQTGINTSAAALSPYQAGGTGALGAYENMLGIGGVQPNFAAFTNSPGYQFQVNQGNQAINRAAAASGNAFSSTTLAQLAAYDQNLASTQYNNYLAQLYGLTQLGANAAVARGNQALTGAGMAGNAQVGSGVAQGAGTVGVANALGQGLARLPWQQIGNYFSGPPSTPGTGGPGNSDATGVASLYGGGGGGYQAPDITTTDLNNLSTSSLFGPGTYTPAYDTGYSSNPS